jgi:hypothetical protein
VDSDSRLARCDAVWWLEWFMRFCVSSGSDNGTRNSDCLALKMKALWSFEMPGTSHWTTQHRIPEDPNQQQHCCEYLRPLTLWIITKENKHFVCHFRTLEPMERFLPVNSDICPQVCLSVCLSASRPISN